MKKWQTWVIVIFSSILIAAAIGASYYYLTADTNEEPKVTEEPAEVKGESDLSKAEEDLNAAKEFDLNELDEAVKELESVDLSGV